MTDHLSPIYISGPMTGLPEHNYPAFHAAAKRLREWDYEVLNPAEMDGGDTSQSWEYYLRQDIALPLTAKSVAVLPGWGESRGAMLEVTIARALGMPVVDAFTLSPTS